VSIQKLPAMIGEAFDLIGTIVRLTKADQKLIGPTNSGHTTQRPSTMVLCY